jgi:DNA-binding transcriptional MerR regulator
MKKLTKTEAAKKLGVSRPTIYSLIKKGVITPDENGLIALHGQSDPLHDVKIQQCFHDVRSVIQSSARLKAKVRDKHVASLEVGLEAQQRDIAHLEKQVEFLEEELKKVRNELKHEQAALICVLKLLKPWQILVLIKDYLGTSDIDAYLDEHPNMRQYIISTEEFTLKTNYDISTILPLIIKNPSDE